VDTGRLTGETKRKSWYLFRSARNPAPIRNERGQTLIDLIVALALLGSAVAAAGALSTASAQVNAEAGRRTQATGLATRELESLRALRDTAERNGSGWDSVPVFAQTPVGGYYTTGANSCRSFYMKLTGSTWTTVPATNPVAFTAANAGDTTANFTFDYGNFSRMTTICPATDYQQTDSQSAVPIGPLAPQFSSSHIYTVSEVVTWSEPRQPLQEVRMNTILSDWLQ
jgi:type II secretory pathway pseudopilin PulG